MRRAIQALLCLLVATPALAANFYVATTGNNANPGSIGSPFLTIVYCVSQMSAGDTCNIRTGTYDEYGVFTYAASGVPVGTSFSNAITIKAYNGESVTWTNTGGTHDAILLMRSDDGVTSRNFYWIIDGIIFDGNKTGSHYDTYDIAGNFADHIRVTGAEVKNGLSDGLIMHGNYWELLDLNVHDNGSGDGGDHGLYWVGSNLLVDGGTYHDNWNYGIHIFDSGTCFTPDASSCLNDNVVRNTKIYGNNVPSSGIHGNGGGIIFATCNRAIAYNNLIYGNLVNGFDIDYRCTDAAVYGNTIYDNSNYGLRIGQNTTVTSTIVKNNISYNNGSTAISDNGAGSTISNNLTANPTFTNAGSGDFTLQSVSAARVANGFSSANLSSLCTGVNISLCSDFAGSSRGTTPDGGAYQYASGTPASISGISPDYAIQGTSVAITVTGASTSFSNGVSVCSLSGTGWTLTSSVMSSATAGVCTFAIDVNATTGLRDVIVTTGGEVATATAAFNIILANSRQFQLFRVH